MTNHWTTGLKSLGAVTAAALALDGAMALPAAAAKVPAPLANGLPAAALCFKHKSDGRYSCYDKAAKAPSSMQCYAEGDHYQCYPTSDHVAARAIPPGYWCDKDAKGAQYICGVPTPPPPPPPPNSNNVPPPGSN